MRNQIPHLAGWIHKWRRIFVIAAIFGVVVTSSWLTFPNRTQAIKGTLLCSARTTAHRSRLLSDSVFQSGCPGMDRIVSGALRFASSL